MKGMLVPHGPGSLSLSLWPSDMTCTCVHHSLLYQGHLGAGLMTVTSVPQEQGLALPDPW